MSMVKFDAERKSDYLCLRLTVQMRLALNSEKMQEMLDPIDRDSGYVSSVEFVLGTHHARLVLVLLNSSISCDDFETISSPGS